MTKDLKVHEDFMRMSYGVVGLPSRVFSRGMRLSVDSRMSGEMSTSCGNGLTNLMISLFVLTRGDIRRVREVPGVVEGDDGLFVVPHGRYPSTADYARLGVVIKIEKHDIVNEAAFCGLVFTRERVVHLVDPRRQVANFGYAGEQYLKANAATKLALLRVKSLSMLVMYAGCPLLQELALYGLRMTGGVAPAFMRKVLSKMRMSEYEKEEEYGRIGMECAPAEVTMEAYLLMEKKFGLSCSSAKKLEDYLRGLNTLQPLVMPELVELYHPDCRTYFDRYFYAYEFDCPISTVPSKTQRLITEIRFRKRGPVGYIQDRDRFVTRTNPTLQSEDCAPNGLLQQRMYCYGRHFEFEPIR
jgi:hypothetical protein